ncbi:unnamed protein product [Nesidiocoris tenuis]|uniref:Uncharacterized protein n=1 Tax=Nesidiocoris tenuis TaxID=355587 RepID=A0A6H5FZ54_9HEMI|nr:unnamed protein product [Nesidiocoris tenuis]
MKSSKFRPILVDARKNSSRLVVSNGFRSPDDIFSIIFAFYGEDPGEKTKVRIFKLLPFHRVLALSMNGIKREWKNFPLRQDLNQAALSTVSSATECQGGASK